MKSINDILNQLRNKFKTAKYIEVTMEINPGETKEDFQKQWKIINN